MIRRLLASAVLLAACAVALSACQSRPGTAAIVGDTRISLNAVDELFNESKDDPVSSS